MELEVVEVQAGPAGLRVGEGGRVGGQQLAELRGHAGGPLVALGGREPVDRVAVRGAAGPAQRLHLVGRERAAGEHGLLRGGDPRARLRAPRAPAWAAGIARCTAARASATGATGGIGGRAGQPRRRRAAQRVVDLADRLPSRSTP